MQTVAIAADAECAGLASLFVATFARWDALDAAEKKLVTVRDAHWICEDAANVLDASPEVIAAWEASLALFDQAIAEVRALRGE